MRNTSTQTSSRAASALTITESCIALTEHELDKVAGGSRKNPPPPPPPPMKITLENVLISSYS